MEVTWKELVMIIAGIAGCVLILLIIRHLLTMLK
jgi:hypothetical protein